MGLAQLLADSQATVSTGNIQCITTHGRMEWKHKPHKLPRYSSPTRYSQAAKLCNLRDCSPAKDLTQSVCATGQRSTEMLRSWLQGSQLDTECKLYYSNHIAYSTQPTSEFAQKAEPYAHCKAQTSFENK